MMTDFKIISINIAMSMLSISDVLKSDKPDLFFLQEVIFSTQTLCDRVDSFDYSGECNVDPAWFSHLGFPGPFKYCSASARVTP